MVELSRGAAIAIGAGGTALVLVLLAMVVRSSRRWRVASRRLAAAATRLELQDSPAGDDRDLIGRVEREAQAAVLRVSDEQAQSDRLAGALAHAGVGVVVPSSNSGDVDPRNPGSGVAEDPDRHRTPRAATVSVTASRSESWVDLAVADRCRPSIPAGELDRIFESFYRCDPDRAGSPAGTSLGLAIASRVAGAHGGTVLVESSEGAGSTFTLRIPAAEGS